MCGVRGGGNAASQALFWQAKKGLSFVLAFESERERNAAVMLARRFAFDCNVSASGNFHCSYFTAVIMVSLKETVQLPVLPKCLLEKFLNVKFYMADHVSWAG